MSAPGSNQPVQRLPSSGLLDALRIQRRVIGALLMREVITRFGRRNLGVLWLVAEPMIFTLGVAAFWSYMGAGGKHGLPIVAFAITGYSSVLMWRNGVGHCLHALGANVNLLYHRVVRPLDVILTRSLLEQAGATGSFVVLSAFFVSLEMVKPPEDLGMVAAGWLLLAWFSTALGLLMGAMATWSPLVERIWHPFSYLLFPLSGAAFMVDWLPTGMQKAVLLLPMVHGVEMLREGYFGGYVNAHYDVGYAAVACLVITFFGMIFLRGATRRLGAE